MANFRTLLFQRHPLASYPLSLHPALKPCPLSKTATHEWAYARTYQNSDERRAQLDPWLHDYTFHRPHASLNHNTPASRADLNPNNLLSLHT